MIHLQACFCGERSTHAEDPWKVRLQVSGRSVVELVHDEAVRVRLARMVTLVKHKNIDLKKKDIFFESFIEDERASRKNMTYATHGPVSLTKCIE